MRRIELYRVADQHPNGVGWPVVASYVRGAQLVIITWRITISWHSESNGEGNGGT
jgi:hypothetical protein